MNPDIAYMPAIRGNITEKENMLLRRALDPASSPAQAAKAMEAFANSLRKRGLSAYDFVPPDPPRGRANQEPHKPEPPPPPKYEPKPPPPREETPPWWTRAKDQPEPPKPPPPPPKDDSWAEYWKRNQESTRERDRATGGSTKALFIWAIVLVSLTVFACIFADQRTKQNSSYQAVKEALASPSPSSSPGYYIGGTYLVRFGSQMNTPHVERSVALSIAFLNYQTMPSPEICITAP